MKYILAIDQGTTSSRALIINAQGEIVASSQRELTQYFPRPGLIEHDALEIWATQSAVMHEALAKLSLRMHHIAAIGITNQRETTLVWDKKSGKPICQAIVWQDRRTRELCQTLKSQGWQERVKKKTGLLLDPYFSATKLQWILDNIEGARERAERGELAFGTIDSWLVWKLTGGKHHVTDASNASRTMLYNIHKEEWDEELLSLFGIPRNMLPTVCESSAIIGKTEDGIPIAGIAGDQHAALFGQCCFTQGMGKITYGTGCFIMLNAGEKPPHDTKHLLTTIGYKIGGRTTYALEGSVFMGGGVVQWLRDNLGIIKRSRDVEALAASVPDTDGVYFVPAFTGLGAPHWDPFAKATIVGLSRGSTSAHIARAALEGIVFQVADILDITPEPIQDLRVDGGASTSNMMMDLQASIQGIPLHRPSQLEVTGLGAAYLAGLAVGYWKSIEEIATLYRREQTFTGTVPSDVVNKKRARWKQALQCSECWHE